MASRVFNQFQGALEKGVVVLYGSITVNNSGAVTASTGKGCNTTVPSKTGTGEYTITLDDKYQSMLMAKFYMESATDQDFTIQGKSHDVASAKTVVFHTLTAGTATDPGAASTFYFELILKNSTV